MADPYLEDEYSDTGLISKYTSTVKHNGAGCVCAGIETNYATDGSVAGKTVSLGAGLGYDYHISSTITETIYQINIKDAVSDIFSTIKGWFK